MQDRADTIFRWDRHDDFTQSVVFPNYFEYFTRYLECSFYPKTPTYVCFRTWCMLNKTTIRTNIICLPADVLRPLSTCPEGMTLLLSRCGASLQAFELMPASWIGHSNISVRRRFGASPYSSSWYSVLTMSQLVNAWCNGIYFVWIRFLCLHQLSQQSEIQYGGSIQVAANSAHTKGRFP